MHDARGGAPGLARGPPALRRVSAAKLGVKTPRCMRRLRPARPPSCAADLRLGRWPVLHAFGRAGPFRGPLSSEDAPGRPSAPPDHVPLRRFLVTASFCGARAPGRPEKGIWAPRASRYCPMLPPGARFPGARKAPSPSDVAMWRKQRRREERQALNLGVSAGPGQEEAGEAARRAREPGGLTPLWRAGCSRPTRPSRGHRRLSPEPAARVPRCTWDERPPPEPVCHPWPRSASVPVTSPCVSVFPAGLQARGGLLLPVPRGAVPGPRSGSIKS